MSVAIQTPEADQTCAYCAAQIFAHDPICVRDCTDDCSSPDYFCNYACLSTYIEENGLTTRNACKWNPD